MHMMERKRYMRLLRPSNPRALGSSTNVVLMILPVRRMEGPASTIVIDTNCCGRILGFHLAHLISIQRIQLGSTLQTMYLGAMPKY